MNFSIEVSGEANPLSLQSLRNVLQSASSNDHQQIRTGTQQLQNWEKSPGFYSSLQTLYIDYSLPVELRYLAILQLKNGIDKYWRKTALNGINAQEKDTIRSRCLKSGVDEPEDRLALQIAVLTAKIVRYEYPQDWPDAISPLLNVMRLYLHPYESIPALESSPPLSRSLLLLLYIVKELSTAKTLHSRAKLASVTPQIIQNLYPIYVYQSGIWATILKDVKVENDEVLDSMKKGLLALRTLRRLIITGYDFPNRHQELCDHWSFLNTQFEIMLSTAESEELGTLSHMQHLLEKHLIQIAKLHLEMARSHPVAFALLPDSIALVKKYWDIIRRCGESYGSSTAAIVDVKIGTHDNKDWNRTPALEKLCLKGLLIIRACSKMVFLPAQTIRYSRDEDKEEKKASKELMKNDLMRDDFAREAMETLVTRFFIFTPQDLCDWEEEPDEWEKSQEGAGEDWELSIRTCAEKLFLDLMINFREILVQPLLEVFQTVASKKHYQFDWLEICS